MNITLFKDAKKCTDHLSVRGRTQELLFANAPLVYSKTIFNLVTWDFTRF